MLSRFLDYINRHCHVDRFFRAATDSRVRPQYPLREILWSVLLMHASRTRSLNALESLLHEDTKRWRQFLGKERPSGDTIARAMNEAVDVGELRGFLLEVTKHLHRTKRLHRMDANSRLRLMALDAHELFATRHKCCEHCKQRTVHTKEGDVTEYYHQVVVCQLIGVEPGVVLDLEPILAGEDEVAAAQRLMERVLEAYPQVFDVLVTDSAYQEAPFFKVLLRRGKHVVATLKDERREVWGDFQGMLPQREPVAESTTKTPYRQTTTRLWSFPDLETWAQLGRKAWVVYLEERTRQRRRRGKEWVEEESVHTWVWITTLTPEEASAQRIAQGGRWRWYQENAFNELGQHWRLDHRFMHAPQAMIAFLLLLFLAYLLERVFYLRHLKEARRKKLTCVGLGERLRAALGAQDDGRVKAPT